MDDCFQGIPSWIKLIAFFVYMLLEFWLGKNALTKSGSLLEAIIRISWGSFRAIFLKEKQIKEVIEEKLK